MLGAVALIAGATFLALRRSRTVERVPITIPPSAIAPATQSASATAATQPTPQQQASIGYVDLIRRKYPNFPATRPLGVPVGYDDAAHVILEVPVYLSPSGDLWITHPQAPPTSQALAGAADDPLHVVGQRVVFVFWTARPDEAGKWNANMIVRDEEAATFEHLNLTGRRALPEQRAFDFSRAFQWNDRVVVPSDAGVSVFDFAADPITEDFCAIVPDELANAGSAPQAVLDTRGVLAWRPWEDGKAGSATIHRYVDGKWSALAGDAGRVVQLVPLLDGSLFQIAIEKDGQARLSMSSLDDAKVDEAEIGDLVAKLSDPDGDVRSAAFNDLTRYGPGSWPVLEKLVDGQPPEAQARLRQLLSSRLRPTLGGMTLTDGKLQLVNRLRDGGALFYAPGGVGVPAADGGQTFVTPAWLSCRPGRPIALLPYALVRDVAPQRYGIEAFGSEWILIDPVLGPRRFMGNHFVDLLKAGEREFNHVVGVDRRGRWLFARSDGDRSQTLIVDPTLPDPTPRLPVWTMSIRNGAVGWTSDGWPVIRRGGAWALQAEGWVALDEAKSPMITEPESADADDSPRSMPTTSPTTQSERPLCVDSHGCTFFGGRDALKRVATDGDEHIWPLPGELAGSQAYAPALIATDDGSLFLFNQPGRVAQIAESTSDPNEFEVRATFTHGIPNASSPTHIWRDPAGRINIVHDGNQLHVLFPNGKIPASIHTLMPAGEGEAEEDGNAAGP